MTQTPRNRNVDGINTGESGAKESDTHVPKVKKKDDQGLVYIPYLVLAAIFVLGCICGRAFGGSGGATSLETPDAQSIITLLKVKNDKNLLEAADIEQLKQLVKELKYVDPSHSKDPKHVSEMSHKEAIETLGQHENPNASWNFFVGKVYDFLFFVGLILFLLLLAWLGIFNTPAAGNRRNPPT